MFETILKRHKRSVEICQEKETQRADNKKNKHVDTSLSIKEIMEDKTKEKEASHLKLKLNIIINANFFNTRVFTKKVLFKLCSAYECPFSQSMKKETLSEMLIKCISSAHGMKNLSVFFRTSCINFARVKYMFRFEKNKKQNEVRLLTKEQERVKEKGPKRNSFVLNVLKNITVMKNGLNAVTARNGSIDNVAVSLMRVNGSVFNRMILNGFAHSVQK